MSFFGKLFAAHPACAGLPDGITQAIDDLERMYPGAIGSIRDAVSDAIKANLPEVQRQIDIGLVKPRDVARQFACNVSGDHLEEGRHHIYRGVMTELGNSLLALYSDCWREDAKCNFTTAESAEEEIAAMRQAVRIAG